MLIKKPGDIPFSEVTPKSVYLNRRTFLMGAAAAGAVGASLLRLPSLVGYLIAGAIAGARYGFDAIPRGWLQALDPDLREELSSLAEALVRKSPLFAGTSPR